MRSFSALARACTRTPMVRFLPRLGRGPHMDTLAQDLRFALRSLTKHPGIAEVVVISDALWRRRFGGAPDTIGRKLRIDDDWYTVVGIMPPGFRHPGRSL